ncbi:MAG: PAS domain S-box protein [Lachnospiraceae bacterium]
MTKRIFRSICLVAITVFSASVILIMGVLHAYFSDVQQEQLKMQTNLAAQGVMHEGMDYFKDLDVSDYRMTWIDGQGAVLYDSQSDSAGMENHLEREEVKAALVSGYGESRRYSATLMERYLYAARRLPDGTVLRLSISQNSILTLLMGMVQPICIVFAVALLLSVALAVRLSGRIVQPFNEIDFDNPLSNEGYDELSPFLRRIASQQRQLASQRDALEQKENELHTIVGSMNEGMILLNEKGKIISMNPAARRLLGASWECVGLDLLSVSRNLDLQEILEKTLRGEACEKVIALQGERYQIDASPVRAEDKVRGAALCFFNVTEKEKAEQMRREFTANVSHELKTPLHAISGYAELLKNDMVKREDVSPFAGKIYDEAQRMTQLVEDIISLSRLDEGAKDMESERTELYGLAAKAVKSLEPEADAARVTMELSGEPADVEGVPQLLYSIVYNLCDNAIKYNREGGKVAVRVAAEKGKTILTVSDTGIGIGKEHWERIFERFYRVDRSHSRAVGSTGLGLSIVKHAVIIHKAEITLDSEEGRGTTVTVKFPL